MLEGNDHNIHHGDTEARRTDEPLAQCPEPQRAQTHTEEIRGTQPGAAVPHDVGEDRLEVVTEDYQTVKLAWHQMFNLKERIRKQMGLPEDWRTDEAKILYYRQQLALLEKADAAPRCEHIRADGTRCRGPRLRAGKKCYAHARMEAARPQTLQLPALEDANSVLLAVMEIQRALLDGLITEKTAGLLLYSVQIGAWAVRHATFAETEPEEMVRTAPALSRQHSALSQTRGQIHRGDAEARRTEEPLANTKSFATEDAKDTESAEGEEANRGLTRMNADEKPARSGDPVIPPKSAQDWRDPGTPAIEGYGDRGPVLLSPCFPAQAGAPAVHSEVSPGMNGVSPMISGMKSGGIEEKDIG